MVKLAVLVGIRPSKTSSRLQVSVAEATKELLGRSSDWAGPIGLGSRPLAGIVLYSLAGGKKLFGAAEPAWLICCWQKATWTPRGTRAGQKAKLSLSGVFFRFYQKRKAADLMKKEENKEKRFSLVHACFFTHTTDLRLVSVLHVSFLWNGSAQAHHIARVASLLVLGTALKLCYMTDHANATVSIDASFHY